MWQDMRYALRTLRASRLFTAVAIGTLGLGIGVTTAIYSVVDSVLLRPLPYSAPDRLVRIVENFPSIFPGRPPLQRGPNYQEYADWRARSATLEDAAAIAPLGQRMITTPDGTFRLWGAVTSPNVFTLLDARAQLGRVLVPADSDHPDVAVLSADTWRRLFHADPAVIGTAIALRAPDPMFRGPVALEGRLLTVVGVLPDAFQLPTMAPMDFLTPIVLSGTGRPPSVTMIGRLRVGVPLDDATREANVIGATFQRPPAPAGAAPLDRPRFEAQRIKDEIVRPLRPALRILLGAVAAVLLIVCANLANLLLARGTARERDVAVRCALGATPVDIARLVVAECVILTLVGGLLGTAIAAAGVTLIKSLASVDAPGIFRLGLGTSILPRGEEVAVDGRMFAAAFGVSVLTTLLFGIVPALQLSRSRAWRGIGLHGASAGRGASRARALLAAGQMVMATVLLVGAGLLLRTFVRLSSVDRGYDPSNVLALQLVLPADYSSTRRAATIDALLARLRAAPEVEAAGFTRAGLLIAEEITVGTFVPPGKSLEEMRRDTMRPLVRPVSGGYLTATGIRRLAGRDFDASDTARSRPAVVISRSVAQRYFGSGNAVGQSLEWHVGNAPPTPIQVVGVVEDVRNTSPERAALPEIWIEYRQALALQERWGDSEARRNELSIGFLSFAIRTRGAPAETIPAVRRIVHDVDVNAGIDAIIPLDRLVADSVARQRFNAVVLGIFASVAAALAALGVYGVVAYAVAQRRREIGIRMALGAGRRQVVKLVLRNSAALTAGGITVGALAAAAAARTLEALLFGVTPLDAVTFATVIVSFGLVSLLASYVPARRATAVDPMLVLRAE